MKKSFMSMILIFVYVFVSVNSVFDVQAQELLYTYTFNKYSVGEQPEGFILPEDAFVNIYGEKDKGLQASIDSRVLNVEKECSIEGSFSVGFDVYTQAEKASIGLTVRDKSGKALKPVSIDYSGQIQTHDGKNAGGGFKKGEVNRVAVGVDVETQRYSIYVNGKKIIGCWRYYGTELSGISAFIITGMSPVSGANLIVDNIVINSSATPETRFRIDPVISGENEKPIEPAPEPEDEIYMYADFENGDPINASLFMGGDKFARYQESDGNWAKRFERVADTRHVYNDVSLVDYTSGNLVIEMDVKLVDSSTSVVLATLKDYNGVFEETMRITSGSLNAGNKSIALATGKWSNIAIVYDFLEHKYDIYYERELVAKGIPISNSAFIWPSFFRISIKQQSNVCFMIDNLLVYRGKELKNFSPEQLQELAPKLSDSVFPSEESIEKFIGDAIALHMRSGVMYCNSEKKYLEETPYFENDVAMIPLRGVCEFLDYEVTYNSETQTASVANLCSFTEQSNVVSTPGGKISAAASATVRNGTMFVPLSALADAMGKKLYLDTSASWNRGMAIISNEIFKPGKRLDELNQFLFFYRPEADEILEDFYNAGAEHPYIYGRKDDFENIKKLMAVDEHIRNGVSESISKADTSIYDAAMAYRITGKEEYARKAYTLLKDLVDDTVWIMGQYLDVGDRAVLLGVGYDLIYDALSDEERKYLEEGMYRQAIAPTLSIYKGESGSRETFAVRPNNWNAVCNGGVAVGALSMMNVYPEECSQIVSFAMRALEYTIGNYAPDGGWYEGPGYWNYGTSHLVYMLAAMDSTLDTDYMIHKTEGLDKTSDFYLMMESSEGYYCFADGTEPDKNFIGTGADQTTFWLAKKFNRPEVADALIRRLEYSGQKLPGGLSLLWYQPELNYGSYRLPKDACYRNIDAASMSSNREDFNSAFVGFKGGKSSREHSHLDLGSFIFDSMGTRWAKDFGSENYQVAGYWDMAKARWEIFRMRAAAHNTLVINPAKNYPADQDLNAYAKITRFDSKDRGAIGVVDLTSAYINDVSSARRAFWFTDDRRSLVIRDELSVNSLSEIYWLMYSDAEDIFVNGNSAVIAKDGKLMNFEFIADGGVLSVEDAIPLPGTPALREEENQNKNTKRLAIKLYTKGKVNITVKLTPYGIDGTKIDDYDKPMDSWRIPDGENQAVLASYEPVMLDSIKINGEILEGFEPGIFNYTLREYEGYFKNHKIEAASSLHDVEVIPGSAEGETARIKVTRKDNPDEFSVYAISYNVVPNLHYFDGYTDIKPVSVEVSNIPQPENAPEMMLDRNLETRWSVDGMGQWAIFDLGDVHTFDVIKMAFYLGDRRKQNLKVSVSKDGVSYNEIFDGTSGGETKGLEDFEFPQTEARYVRIEYNHTSYGSWNSPTEVIFLKKNN